MGLFTTIIKAIFCWFQKAAGYLFIYPIPFERLSTRRLDTSGNAVVLGVPTDYHQASIGCLQPELLANIFLLSIPENPPRFEKVVATPMILCHVCQIWRLVALETPHLWTHLRLTFKEERKLQLNLIALKHWAERSQGCPISLSINYKIIGLHNITLQIIREARIHMHRWSQVIGSMPLLVLSRLWEPSDSKPSMLRNIDISVHDTLPRAESTPTVDLTGASLINSISLDYDDSSDEDDYYPQLKLSCEQPIMLQELSLYGFCVPKECIWQLLSNSPQLTICDLEIVFLGSFRPDQAVTLPGRTNLDIATQDHRTARDFGPILSGLCLPSLRKCRISAESTSITRPWPHVMNMLQQSQPPLRQLVLSGSDMLEGDFVGSLKAVPQLRRLVVGDAPYTDAILEALTLKSTDGLTWRGLCPQLTTINLVECLPPSDSCLIAMILSRRGPFQGVPGPENDYKHVLTQPRTLQSISIDLSPVNASITEHPEIAEFIREGLEFWTDQDMDDMENESDYEESQSESDSSLE